MFGPPRHKKLITGVILGLIAGAFIPDTFNPTVLFKTWRARQG